MSDWEGNNKILHGSATDNFYMKILLPLNLHLKIIKNNI